MRPIDADALMRELGINDMRCDKCGWGQYGYCKRGADFTDACFAIENAPPLDVVERKTAYLVKPNPYGTCSECGYLIDIRDKFNFCPQCGSRIEVEE